MDEGVADNSADAVEIARGLEPLEVSQLLDTTAFFESLKLNEEGGDVVTTSAGDTIRLGAPDEVNIDAFMGAQQFVTTYPADSAAHSDSESSKSASNASKLQSFLNNLKRDPEWARSISYVKLSAAVQKDIQLELINHAYLNVNARPQMMIIMSTTMGADDITEGIKAILLATTANPAIEVEYTDVLGEMSVKGVKLRMKTSDVNTFLKLEHRGRALGMRFLTTFHCRSSASAHRTMDIRYYDEVKSNGTRVNYVHLDHETFNDQSVKFGGVSVEIPPVVDSEELTPLRLMYPPIYDLNEAIVKLHKQLQSSTHPDSP
ncbi:hypothetical protein OESDEN_00699 [Oesophagostomum dentatum]|uniref:Uncharacterized protein n=1 Tax=Oesophagostomum dentatum TaxID=61180 RepID=A0A0B1TPX7_OESDE|nr:hypothetical protein OESDEN_00699 [Oesophagostomum dentatum]